LATSNTHPLKMNRFRFDELALERNSERGHVDKSLERLSWLMDDLFRVPVLGWRFGLDALIGLIPGLGDTTTSLVSFYILVAAVRYRVSEGHVAADGSQHSDRLRCGIIAGRRRSCRCVVEVEPHECRLAAQTCDCFG